MDEQITRALQAYALARTVPTFVYDKDGEKAEFIFTSTLLARDDRLFLITARHNLDDWDEQLLAVPEAPLKSNLLIVGTIRMVKPDDQALDIAIIELMDDDAKSKLLANWETVSGIDVDERNGEKSKLLYGYPAETLGVEPERFTGRPLTVFTQDYAGTPRDAEQPIYANVDQFFVHEEKGFDADGNEAELPSLKGMSGCSVWQISEIAEGELWAPSKVLKIIGVQSSCRPGRFIRAKSWAYVRGILDRI